MEDNNIEINSDYVDFIDEDYLYCVYHNIGNSYIIMEKRKAVAKKRGTPLFVGLAKECIEWVRNKIKK